MPTFVPGLELARQFFAEQVQPVLESAFPGLPYSAALIGPGSEVLGFDSARSADHDWGPRLQLFLADSAELATWARAVRSALAEQLPARFRGYPTTFPRTADGSGNALPGVEVGGLRDWLTKRLGFDPRDGVTLADWLATPTQLIAEVTGGAVFHDGMAAGGLGAVRAALAWYPRDVWLYVLACQWQRLDQEEPFPGRCAEAGDDLGSALVTSRLVRDMVRLVLLLERRYPPYSKWLGSAFAQTAAAARLEPLLRGALSATAWRQTEDYLVASYEAVAGLHNMLGLTPFIDPVVRTFYDRPYRVLGAARFARALRDSIADERIRALPLIGAVDQFVDSTDAIGQRWLLRSAIDASLALLPAGEAIQ